MRKKLIPAALAACLCLASGGCQRRQKVRVQQTDEEAPTLATTVHVADPRVSAQLLNGFYSVEQNSWRWTSGKFSVLLRPPRTAAQKGAVLKFKFSVPDPIIASLKTVTLSASVNSTPLAPETYSQAGEFTYSRDVPAALVSGDAAKVEFALDKTFAPSGVDQRQLGVVASMIGFDPK